jgi:dephospho-CoA kinase
VRLTSPWTAELTVPIDVDCFEDVGLTSYRELACHLRHQFRSDLHECPIIGIDGFSGSGKSDFAQALALELGATVVNSHDLVQGWDGLRASIDLLQENVLDPIARGETASWRRFDWQSMRPMEWHELDASHVVIVEGCGVGHRKLSSFLSYLIWVNASETQRLERIRNRFDWETYEPFVDQWARQERTVIDGDDVIARANLVVETGVVSDDVDPKAAFVQRIPESWRV